MTAPVVFDNQISTSGGAVSTLTTPAFTITSLENRIAVVNFESDGTITTPSASCGVSSQPGSGLSHTPSRSSPQTGATPN